MLLATYQIYGFADNGALDLAKEGEYLTDVIDAGTRMLRCFPAGTLRELYTGSVMSLPGDPMSFYVFEADDFIRIDRTKLLRAYKEHRKAKPEELAAGDGMPEECAEYLVPAFRLTAEEASRKLKFYFPVSMLGNEEDARQACAWWLAGSSKAAGDALAEAWPIVSNDIACAFNIAARRFLAKPPYAPFRCGDLGIIISCLAGKAAFETSLLPMAYAAYSGMAEVPAGMVFATCTDPEDMLGAMFGYASWAVKGRMPRNERKCREELIRHYKKIAAFVTE